MRESHLCIGAQPAAVTMVLLIDNYDSFTYNLLHYLAELGVEVEVQRNDAVTPEAVLELAPPAVVISPGPCDPDKAGICLELVEKVSGVIPLLGVCLGHQAIAQAFGGHIIRAEVPMHGKVSQIVHQGEGVFADIPSPFDATRYHSLIAEKESVPKCLQVTAETEDGIIMGLQHKEHNTHGVQFHPESIASQHGHTILKNFLTLAGVREA